MAEKSNRDDWIWNLNPDGIVRVLQLRLTVVRSLRSR